jgi:hypothetical protein
MRQEYDGKKNTLSYTQFNHCAYFISAMLVHSGLNMVHEVAMTMWWTKNTHTHTRSYMWWPNDPISYVWRRSTWISPIYILSRLWVAMKLKCKKQCLLYIMTFEWWILRFPLIICDHHSCGEWIGDTLFEI